MYEQFTNGSSNFWSIKKHYVHCYKYGKNSHMCSPSDPRKYRTYMEMCTDDLKNGLRKSYARKISKIHISVNRG